MAGLCLFTNGMDASQQRAKSLPLSGEGAIEREAAHLRKDGEENAVRLRKRIAVGKSRWSDDGNFRILAVEHEIVFVTDGGFRPSAWTVELCDECQPVSRVHFIDAIDMARAWADKRFDRDAESVFDHIDGMCGRQVGECLQ